MNDLKTNCKEYRERLPDLLFDPASVPASIEQHAITCDPCKDELTSLLATFNLLNRWTAPEPSPYFDTRLRARVREAQAAPVEGFFERMRSFLLFSTGRSLRPAVAGALALVLVVSGGSFVGIHGFHAGSAVNSSATVNDLKLMDNNAQTLQQMGQLLDDNDDQYQPPTT